MPQMFRDPETAERIKKLGKAPCKNCGAFESLGKRRVEQAPVREGPSFCPTCGSRMKKFRESSRDFQARRIDEITK